MHKRKRWERIEEERGRKERRKIQSEVIAKDR